MTRRRRHDVIRFVALSCLAIGLVADVPARAEKRPITPKDLMRFTWAADPQIAPDGTRAVFVKVTVDAEKDDYVTSLWVVPSAKAQMQPSRDG